MSKFSSLRDRVLFYRERFGGNHYEHEAISEKPTGYAFSIVIPCFNEPDILQTLNSLAGANSPEQEILVVIVVNAPESAPESVINQNNKSLRAIGNWQQTLCPDFITLKVINAQNLPARKSGVGLARKIGMDAALYAMASNVTLPYLVTLDADCTVSNNYLVKLEQVLKEDHPDFATLYYEHNLSNLNEKETEAIRFYELFLRYYGQALRFIGYPQSFHTIGSCMVVRAGLYATSGGMNTRKAGEDFYFLHKLARLGQHHPITGTCVYPAARISDRVPFGTGRALMNWQNGDRRYRNVYNWEAFEQLRLTRQQIDQRPIQAVEPAFWSEPVLHALQELGYLSYARQATAHASHEEQLREKLLNFFTGFRVMQWFHYFRDQVFPDEPLLDSSIRLLNKIGNDYPLLTLEECLQHYRNLDRNRVD